jgi:hypothetical protein
MSSRNKMRERMRDLFHHLVGAGKQHGRHGQAECLGGLEVNDQLVFGRRLYR